MLSVKRGRPRARQHSNKLAVRCLSETINKAHRPLCTHEDAPMTGAPSKSTFQSRVCLSGRPTYSGGGGTNRDSYQFRVIKIRDQPINTRHLVSRLSGISSNYCHQMSHLRLKCTKLFPASVHSSVCPTVRFAFDESESQRRRHGVTAAIVVDVVGALRPCMSLCPSVRSFVRVLWRHKNDFQLRMQQ